MSRRESSRRPLDQPCSFSLDGDEGKGSGRAPLPFDLHAGLSECRDLLVRFGGHRAAAGVTIQALRVEEFAQRFNDVARSKLTREDLHPELRIDAEISIDDVTDELEGLLRHFEPFGVGNPLPVFASRGVRLSVPARVVGTDGLKLRIAGSTRDREALGWGMGDLAPELAPGVPFDIAYRIERDTYQGESRLQLRIADIPAARRCIRTGRSLGMRIVAGRWRGRRIRPPADGRVRPTADRVREAWMSIDPAVPRGRAGARSVRGVGRVRPRGAVTGRGFRGPRRGERRGRPGDS